MLIQQNALNEKDEEGVEHLELIIIDSPTCIDTTQSQPLEISEIANNRPKILPLPNNHVDCLGWHDFLCYLSGCVIKTLLFPIKGAWHACYRQPKWKHLGCFILLQIMTLVVIDQKLQSFYQKQGVPLRELKEMEVRRVDFAQLCLYFAFNLTSCGGIWTNQTQAYWESHLPTQGSGRHQDKLAKLFDCHICEPGRSDEVLAMEKTYLYIKIFLVIYGLEMSAILSSCALSLYKSGREKLSQSLQQTWDDVKRLCQELEPFDVEGLEAAQNKLSKTTMLQHWKQTHEEQLQSSDVSYAELMLMMVTINSIRSKIQCQDRLDHELTFPQPVADYIHLPYRLSKTKVSPAPEAGVLVTLCDLFSRKKGIHYYLMVHVMSFLSDHFSVFDAMSSLRDASLEVPSQSLSICCR